MNITLYNPTTGMFISVVIDIELFIIDTSEDLDNWIEDFFPGYELNS